MFCLVPSWQWVNKLLLEIRLSWFLPQIQYYTEFWGYGYLTVWVNIRGRLFFLGTGRVLQISKPCGDTPLVKDLESK